MEIGMGNWENCGAQPKIYIFIKARWCRIRTMGINLFRAEKHDVFTAPDGESKGFS
jgi:hypothetical protein